MIIGRWGIFNGLSKGEVKFVFLIILLILTLTVIPLIFGYLLTPADKFYTNIPFLAGADRMVYLSQIEEISQGRLTYHNLYSSEPQPVGIFSPLWFFLGWLKRLTGLSSLFVFHLARIILGAVFLFLLYFFLARIFKEIKWRKIIFLILSFGSGLGIFTFGANFDPDYLYEHLGTDFWVSEGNTFLSLYHSPLFIFSQLLMLVIFWWAIERLSKAGFWEVLGLGFLALILGLTHPYDLIIVFSVLGVWFILRCLLLKKWFWKLFFKLFLIGLIGGLAFAYFYYLKLESTAFAEWLKQNITLSPKIFNYFIGYGLIFVFYLMGVYRALKSRNKYLFFLGIWSIVGWFLLFSPLPWQRKLANGFHIPLAIIAGLGLILAANFLKNKLKITNQFFKSLLLNLIILGLVSSNLFIVGFEIGLIFKKNRPMYITKDESLAIRWLKDNLSQDDLILSSSKIGNLIPAYSAKNVYIGHGHQTSYWIDKLTMVNHFFFLTNSADEQKLKWLKENGINYVFFGPQENALGDFSPQTKSYLKLVYQEGQAFIYRINQN